MSRCRRLPVVVAASREKAVFWVEPVLVLEPVPVLEPEPEPVLEDLALETV